MDRTTIVTSLLAMGSRLVGVLAEAQLPAAASSWVDAAANLTSTGALIVLVVYVHPKLMREHRKERQADQQANREAQQKAWDAVERLRVSFRCEKQTSPPT